MRKTGPSDQPLKSMLEQHASRLLFPLQTFILKQATSSVLLVISSAIAIVVANSSWRELPNMLGGLDVGLVLGTWRFVMPLSEWISQGLMALFFFMGGLEVKREILAGTLRRMSEVRLIVSGAAGGIIVPALLYLALNFGDPGQRGWAIPTATDTAFALGVLAVFSGRVTVVVTVFLTAISIFDDIGAIFIIAIFYASHICVAFLVTAGFLFASLVVSNLAGVRSGWIYALLGMLLWICLIQGGVHGTFAGLAVALTIPSRATISQNRLLQLLRRDVVQMKKTKDDNLKVLESQKQHDILADMTTSLRAASTPLQRWESALAAPIAILVLPTFAIFNAGISFDLLAAMESFQSPVTWGIALGMLVGKPLGVLLFLFLAIKLKIGNLPKGIGKNEILAVALLTGIGFTMSIFFSTLSFAGSAQLTEAARLAIFISSVIAAGLASLWIKLKLPRIA